MPELTVPYILSQIFAILWFTFLIPTFFAKSIAKIRICTALNALCLIISFLLLNALTGMGGTILTLTLSLILCLPFFEKSKNFTLVHAVLLVSSWLTMITITLFTYQGWPSLLPCIAVLLHSYSVIQKNPLIYKPLSGVQPYNLSF